MPIRHFPIPGNRGLLVAAVALILSIDQGNCCENALSQTRGSVSSDVRYQTVNMDWRYRGEAKGLSLLVWLRGYNVRYLTTAESDQLEVWHDGRTWRYAQTDEVVADSDLDYWLLTMDARGRIYVGTGSFEDIHHSSVARGGAVASAGIVRFDSTGNFRWYQDATGHYYRPFSKRPGLNWQNLVTELKRRNVDCSHLNFLPHDGAMMPIGQQILRRLVDKIFQER